MKKSVEVFAMEYEAMCKKVDEVVDFLLANELPDVIWSSTTPANRNLRVMAGEILIATKSMFELRLRLTEKIETFLKYEAM